MFILKAHWVDGDDDAATYDVTAQINEHVIWVGTVSGHKRKQGFAKLLRRIAREAELHPREGDEFQILRHRHVSKKEKP
jgi:hypothetical protein